MKLERIGTILASIITFTVLLLAIYSFKNFDPTFKKVDTSSAIITLSRTACQGFCPSYSLTIKGDGSVIYRGNVYVKTQGEKTFTIPPEKARELVTDLYAIDFFNLKDGPDIIDAPALIISLTINGKHHIVTNGPTELYELGEKIDAAVGTKKLIGSFCNSSSDPSTCKD